MKVSANNTTIDLGPEDVALVLRSINGVTKQEVFIPTEEAYPDDLVPHNAPIQILTVAVRALQRPFYAIIKEAVDMEMATTAQELAERTEESK